MFISILLYLIIRGVYNINDILYVVIIWIGRVGRWLFAMFKIMDIVILLNRNFYY